MILARPHGLLTSGFDLVGGEVPLATMEGSFWREGGRVHVGNDVWELRRQGWSAFRLVRNGLDEAVPPGPKGCSGTASRSPTRVAPTGWSGSPSGGARTPCSTAASRWAASNRPACSPVRRPCDCPTPCRSSCRCSSWRSSRSSGGARSRPPPRRRSAAGGGSSGELDARDDPQVAHGAAVEGGEGLLVGRAVVRGTSRLDRVEREEHGAGGTLRPRRPAPAGHGR